MDWMDDGLCREVDWAPFFPPLSTNARAAKRICARCRVKTECLEWALEHEEQGIWGGTSDEERRKLKRYQ